MLYSIRVEPLRTDVKEADLRRLFGDFGDIRSVRIVKAPKKGRFNRITKKRDIIADAYAIVSYTDSRAVRMAIANFDNKL
ncbi:hypothetical protein AAVH_02498 [Aphelenchoides avenae]|nr:hypothetical protein AAVH_02498 [Aphelenchus avenae]